jgi:HEAT repeat protein
MQSDTTLEIFNALVRGREPQRIAAQTALTDPAKVVDRPRLRLLIMDAIRRDFYAGKEWQEQDLSIAWTRAWLLGALARISNGDAEAEKLVRLHLDYKVEGYYWVRYWTLEGLVAVKATDIEPLARKLVGEDKEPLVFSLAQAILALRGDEEARKQIEQALCGDDLGLQWAALRALRIVPLSAMFGKIAEIVEKGDFSDATYDAIVALGKATKGSSHAESAERALTNFVARFRTSPMRDGMRMMAIQALGALRMERASPLLIEELTGDNPAIVREAAQALEKALGVRTAAERVVEAASKAGSGNLEAFGRALRWMDRDAVVQQLETVMVSGYVEHQEIARHLLSEIGGAAAFQKLQARTRAIAQYTAELEKAEEKIRNLFETSIREAQIGFKISAIMDQIVFALGILLIASSAVTVLTSGSTLDKWAGVGITGGTGLLGVLYGIVVAKPREKIVEAVDHLMRLKVIFLGYLRQLHQADQAYTRRLLEDKPLAPDEVDKFSRMIEQTMRRAVDHLILVKPGKAPAETK